MSIKLKTLDDVFFNVDEIKEEIKLSCVLKANKNIQMFCIDIVIKIFKTYINYGCSVEEICKNCNKTIPESIMSPEYKKIDNKIYVQKPGLSSDEIKFICSNIDNKKLIYEKFENNLHTVHGSLYNIIINMDFFKLIIDNDTILQNKIIKTLKQSLHINTTWNEFKSNLNKSNEFFLLDILTSITSDNKDSIFRLKLYNKPYIRNKDKSGQNYKYSDNNFSSNILSCHDDYTKEANGIIWANSYYSINKGSLFDIYMRKYNRPYIAGPSGSIVLLHILTFDLLKIEKTKENKIKIFAISIADYIPFSHTLTEIILSYSNELNIDYTLDMDPISFAIDVISNMHDEELNKILKESFLFTPVSGSIPATNIENEVPAIKSVQKMGATLQTKFKLMIEGKETIFDQKTFLERNNEEFVKKRNEFLDKYYITIPKGYKMIRTGKYNFDVKPEYTPLYFIASKGNFIDNLREQGKTWIAKCKKDEGIQTILTMVKKDAKLLPMSLMSYELENQPLMKLYLDELIRLINVSILNENDSKFIINCLKNLFNEDFGKDPPLQDISDFFKIYGTNPDLSVNILFYIFGFNGWIRLRDNTNESYSHDEIQIFNNDYFREYFEIIFHKDCSNTENNDEISKLLENNEKQPKINTDIFENEERPSNKDSISGGHRNKYLINRKKYFELF